MRFRDRADAGRRLASLVEHLRDRSPVVLGLPRGGVPVAAEVARALDAPLDVVVVRKLGVPFQPELGMGAIGEGGVRVLNDDVLRAARLTEDEIEAVERRERAELARRVDTYRRGGSLTDLCGRTAIVVDDGIATGATARAACRVARAGGAAHVVLAVPVAPVGWERSFASEADECIAVATPSDFRGVGQFYDDFRQTTDEDVVACLGRAGVDEDVAIPVDDVVLQGRLTVPPRARGVVVFAHGSGSSRHSPRNRYVAAVLNDAGIGTLLLDLLTEAEERDRANVFDVSLLGRRLVGTTDWLQGQPATSGLGVSYFGASTGAAAALWAASRPGVDVDAVVSRGGRPDLAEDRLGEVRAPTLLLVGGRDDVVLDLNRRALRALDGRSRLVVVPGATHLFEEPGALESVARLAGEWFERHASVGASPSP